MRCFVKIYGGFKSVSSSSTSQCHRATPCLSSFVPYSTSSFFGTLNAPLPTCSMMPGLSKRHYATYDATYDANFPRITQLEFRNFPFTKAWTSNCLISDGIIKPILDKSFSTTEFLYTSKKMVERVSRRIADGDFEALQGLVTPDVIEEIKTNLPKFSSDQRQDLAVYADEIYISYMDDFKLSYDEESKKMSVEILTVHQALTGVQEEVKMAVETFGLSFASQAKKNKIRQTTRKSRGYVLNYRFLRTYDRTGETEADDWIINGVQQVPIKPSGESVVKFHRDR